MTGSRSAVVSQPCIRSRSLPRFPAKRHVLRGGKTTSSSVITPDDIWFAERKCDDTMRMPTRSKRDAFRLTRRPGRREPPFTLPCTGSYLTDGRRLFRVVSQFAFAGDHVVASFEDCHTLDVQAYAPSELCTLGLRIVQSDLAALENGGPA